MSKQAQRFAARFGVLCLVMSPGALGRCDPPHALLFGMGASMLLMICLANNSRRAFTRYAVAYAAVFVFFIETVNVLVFYGISHKTLLSPHPIAAVMDQFRTAGDTTHPDMATLSKLDRYPRLGLPVRQLWRSGRGKIRNYPRQAGAGILCRHCRRL